MKRPLTLTSLIINVSMQSIFAILLTVVLFEIDNIIPIEKQTAVYIFFGVFLACVLVSIIFSALSIKYWNKPKDEYQKAINSILLTMSLNCVCVVASIIFACIGFMKWAIVFCVFEVLALIAVIVLACIDIYRAKNTKENKQSEVKKEKEEEKMKTNIAGKTTSIADKIEKLADMKARGLIDEKEFKQLKEKYMAEKPVVKKPKTEFEIKMEKLDDMKKRGLINEKEYKALKMKYVKEMVG